MNKAFTNEDAAADSADDDEVDTAPALPHGTRNYMTPAGYARLSGELDQLTRVERPQLVATVSWAAGNGDRSENGDYIYGKKRLREIDRRIRFLVRRLDLAEVVDPARRGDDDNADQVFFGASVTIRDAAGATRTLAIVGIDEIDTTRGYISWISPMARALMRSREGDVVTLHTPGGVESLDVLRVQYQDLAFGAA
ncbi:MAG: transcription elongation factor GreB [Casimicrobiaceae bacterium]